MYHKGDKSKKERPAAPYRFQIRKETPDIGSEGRAKDPGQKVPRAGENRTKRKEEGLHVKTPGIGSEGR